VFIVGMKAFLFCIQVVLIFKLLYHSRMWTNFNGYNRFTLLELLHTHTHTHTHTRIQNFKYTVAVQVFILTDSVPISIIFQTGYMLTIIFQIASDFNRDVTISSLG